MARRRRPMLLVRSAVRRHALMNSVSIVPAQLGGGTRSCLGSSVRQSLSRRAPRQRLTARDNSQGIVPEAQRAAGVYAASAECKRDVQLTGQQSDET